MAIKRLGKRIKDDAVYLGARLGLFLGARIPRCIGLFLFGVIARVFFLLPNRDKRWTIEHLRSIYGSKWAEKRINATARKVYIGLGKNLFDAIHLPRQSAAVMNRIVRHDDLTEIKEAYSRGKGIVAITAHVGCFEMLLHFFTLHGFRCFAVGRKLYDHRLDTMVRSIRSGPNIEYMDRTENPRRILRFLQDGRMFGALIDQDTKVEGVFARFLGKLAYSPSGAMRLAMRYDIPVFVIVTIRCPGDTHYISISNELQLTNTGNFSEDLVRNVQMANDLISNTIQAYPAQWVWMHRRWRRQPTTPGLESVPSIGEVS